MTMYGMRPAPEILLITLLSWGASALASEGNASDEFSGLEEHMTVDELDDTGVSRLAPEERDKLNAWIADYFAERSSELRQARPEVAEKETGAPQAPRAQDEEKDEFEARVIPTFEGWSGSTVFKLENGQVWKQRQPGRLSYSGKDSTVVIKKNFFGFYELHHPASGRSVGVTRLD